MNKIPHNYRAEKIRSNSKSKTLVLAQIFALNSLSEAIRQMKKVGFIRAEIEGLVKE